MTHDPHLDRRQWLAATTAAGFAGLLAAGQVAARSDETYDRIDTHQHLWDLKRFRLPWTDGNEKLARDFLIPEYRQATAGTGITTAIYMEVGMEASQQADEAQWVIELCEDPTSGTMAGVIAGNPIADGFEAYAQRFAASERIKGIRHLLHVPETPAGTCRTPEYRRNVARLGELGLRFDLCVRPGELDDAFALARDCPETRFVLDHCGNADPVAFAAADRRPRAADHDADAWRRSIERLASLDNVVCKISGIIARVDPEHWHAEELAPIVDHCLDAFGSERVMFAGDWPVCTLGAPLAAWVEALDTITETRSPEFRRRLYRDNANRFYALGLGDD
ncbi:MAG TPA: amidohydrolase [Planctomycetaceae bacterium]|nr:amidohydrolase [Planctomycetaceae bacterium]HRE99957.1 amidohydrolase family protein [Pirellulaceae bacterium]